MEGGLNSNKKISTRKIAISGMLSAISIFLGMTGLGFIPIPPVKATIMHIPVIIGAIVEGPIVGAITGFVFGLFSMYQAFTAPGPTSFIFWNPIIAIVPRVLIGLVSYYVYKSLPIKKASLKVGIATVLGTFVNTLGVLGLTYIIYLDKFAKALNMSTTAAKAAILSIGVTNGIPEMAISALITVPIILALKKMIK